LIASGRALWRYVAPYRIRYAVGLACLGTATLLGLAIPWTVKQAIDALQAQGAEAPLGRFVALILALAVANGVARLSSRFAIVGAAQRVEAAIRDALYASVQTFPPAVIAARTTGDLMTRASSDVAAVRGIVGFGAVSLMGTAFAFVGAVAAMIAIDPWLTLWAVLPYPALVVLLRRLNTRLHERTDAVQNQLSVVSGRVQEYLAGMTVVRAYAMEQTAVAGFEEANDEYVRLSLRLARAEALFSPVMGLIAGVGTLIVLWVGGKSVVDGRFSLGALVAFNGYLAYLAWPTLALGWTLAMLRRGLTSMARIQEITEAALSPPGVDGAPRFTGPASIRFSGLTFAYGDRPPVLRDVTFEVGHGEMVAIVGPTGSGKSTLGFVAARLWDPPAGTVFVGGEDVTKLDLATLRGSFGYVPQESFLFSRTLLDNVTLGRGELGLAEARAATGVAGVTDEVEALPHGFRSIIGERGLTLSGGQRGRVALARALAAAPPILILDDVFANVDSAKEEEILRNLRESAGGRTTLVMTHRLRVARVADRVVVLEAGQVVSVGPHDELLRASPLYSRLWRIQQLEEEIAHAP
jgi:ATP-binding cassette subfamily B multidrug efflux pump